MRLKDKDIKIQSLPRVHLVLSVGEKEWFGNLKKGHKSKIRYDSSIMAAVVISD